MVKNIYQVTETQNERYVEQQCLISMYVSLVQSVLESISAVSKDYRNLNPEFIAKLVLSKLNLAAK